MNIFSPIQNLIARVLPQSSTKKLALKGVTWLAGDKIVRLGISVFTGALVTRYLGPEKYGILSALTAYAALFGPIANMGVNSLIIRDVAAHPEEERKVVDAAILLKLFGGIIAFLFAVSLALFANQPQYEPFLVVIATVQFLFYFLESIEIWFLAKHQQKKPIIASQISFLFTSILRVAFIYFDLGLAAILFTYALDSILGGIFVYITARKYFSFTLTSLVYDKTKVRQLFRETLPLILSGLGSNIYMKIDKVIMPWLTTAFTLGIYSAATRLSELWYFVPYSVSTALAPLIAEAKSKTPDIYEKRIRKSLVLINLVTFIIAAFTFLIGPLAISLYAGEKYSTALPALQVHIWSLPFISMGLIVDIWLVNERLQKVQVARTFMTAALNIVLNILLVPNYGAVGAAWATLIAYTYPGFFANLLDSRTRKIFWIELQSILPTPKNIKFILEK